MLNKRVQLRIASGAAVGAMVVAASLLTGASGASAHTQEEMARIQPMLDRMPQGELLANYLGGDGSLMREFMSNPRAFEMSDRSSRWGGGLSAPSRTNDISSAANLAGINLSGYDLTGLNRSTRRR